MLLLALQTTSSSVDDRIDAVTLVLVLLFIGSMAGLSFLLHRRPGSEQPEPPAPTAPEQESTAVPESAPRTLPRRERPPIPPVPTAPRWLEGVTFPEPEAGLAEATQVIEALLAARRDRDLARGLGLYSPALLALLRDRLGVDEAGLAERLDRAEFHGDSPALRSVELLDAIGDRMTVRAGYANGSSERYRLVRSGGVWLIDSIE